MVTNATPIITQQANGSFAENTTEINSYKIAASHHEIEYNKDSIKSSGKSDDNRVTTESINL